MFIMFFGFVLEICLNELLMYYINNVYCLFFLLNELKNINGNVFCELDKLCF